MGRPRHHGEETPSGKAQRICVCSHPSRIRSQCVWSGVSEHPPPQARKSGCGRPLPAPWVAPKVARFPATEVLAGTSGPGGPRPSTHLLCGHLQLQELGLPAQHVPGRVDLYESDPVNLGLGGEKASVSVYSSGLETIGRSRGDRSAAPQSHPRAPPRSAPRISPLCVVRGQQGPEGVPGSKTPEDL